MADTLSVVEARERMQAGWQVWMVSRRDGRGVYFRSEEDASEYAARLGSKAIRL